MSAPVIWIIIPGVVAVILFFLRRLTRLVSGLGLFSSIALWVTSWLLPLGQVSSLGDNVFKVDETLFVLGREFILRDVDRPFITLLFILHMCWIIGARFSRPGDAFIPFSFALVALLTAALAVEPFLYAALLVEISVLIAIPLLSPPQQKPGRGIFRFLTLQTMGMPFILLAGWFLAGLEASPGLSDLVIRAGLLIGIGFSFLLAIVPFHSWIPMLAEESDPYTVAFIFFMLPGMISLFGLGFLDRFVWLRESPAVFQGLRLVGALMVIVGGAWAAAEKKLGRMLGYAALSEMGSSLLAIGVAGAGGVLLYFWLTLVRAFSLIPWAAALSRIRQDGHPDLRLESMRGYGHQRPLWAGLALISQFSLIGLPFLAGFSAHLALWRSLAAVDILSAGVSLLGSLGLLVAGIRVLIAWFVPVPAVPTAEDLASLLTQGTPEASRRLFDWILVFFLVLFISLAGLFPHIYLPGLERLLLMFEQITK